ncbi:MAG: murein L,D-transpeptidase family protein [Bacteroidia bacterium]
MLPSRLTQALAEKGEVLRALLATFHLKEAELQVFFRAFKQEKILEVWAKKGENLYQLLKTYPICAASGELGPKKKEGDKQVPEGLYEIVAFNPESKYHLSLRLNYPNEYDLLHHSDKEKPGGDIYIHGGCESVGCLAMTDEAMQEIFVLAWWAKEAKRGEILCYIFPFRFNEVENWREMGENRGVLAFWEELEKMYE